MFFVHYATASFICWQCAGSNHPHVNTCQVQLYFYLDRFLDQTGQNLQFLAKEKGSFKKPLNQMGNSKKKCA